MGVFWKIQEICSKMGTRILKIALEMTEIIDPKVGNPLEKKAKSAIKWYFQNPVCLTFCAVTWSIFHVGRKVRWVLKSSSSGLLKNGQKFFWMCSVTQENNKIEVQTVLLDTLYFSTMTPSFHVAANVACCHLPRYLCMIRTIQSLN